MAELKVEYYLDRCVGNKRCILNDPADFGFSGGKAVLKNSKKEGGRWVLKKSFSPDELNRIVNAAKSCPVNAIAVADLKTGKDVVSSAVTLTKNFKDIKAAYDDAKEFYLDPKGYFLIRVDKGKGVIEAAFCKSRNIVELKVSGEKAIDIYMTILREKVIDRPDHAAYLGRELAKAEMALKNNLEYVQDDELKIKK